MGFFRLFISFMLLFLVFSNISSFKSGLDNFHQNIIKTKQIVLEGGTLLHNPESLERASSYNNFLWYFTPEKIENEFKADPLVQKAKVEPCKVYSINCYHVELSESQADFILELNNNSYWLISKHKEFLKPLSPNHIENFNQFLPIIAMTGETGKTEAQMAKLQAIFDFLAETQRVSDVKRISLQTSGKLEIEFREQNFKVIFSGLKNNSAKRQQIELARLNQVRTALSDKYRPLSVDLSYEKQAVIKLNEESLV